VVAPFGFGAVEQDFNEVAFLLKAVCLVVAEFVLPSAAELSSRTGPTPVCCPLEEIPGSTEVSETLRPEAPLRKCFE